MARLTASRVIARLGDLGLGLAAAALLLMMAIGAIDIIGTAFFGIPLPAALEATESLMVLVAFLALAKTQAERQHIAVELLTTRLRRVPREVVGTVTLAITLAMMGLVAWGGWVLALQSWAVREYAEGIIAFPIYPSKFALAIGATLMVVQGLVDLLSGARGRHGS